MNHDLISVIVPVYNVKQYLKRCIDSIINQTYLNLEIILVDDGSTDGSEKICDAYCLKDKRVRVIHKTNGGLSEARNTGIDTANGKYVSFVDSDDFLHPEFIEMLYGNMCEYKAEVSICGFIKGGSSRFPGKIGKNTCRVFERKEMLSQWHGKYKHIETQAWNKLYLTDLFIDGGLRYPKGMNHEDVQTTHLVVAASNRVVISKQELYYYFQRKDSIVHSTLTEKRIYDIFESQKIRLDFFRESGYVHAYERLKIKLQKYLMVLYCLTAKSKLFESKYDFLKMFQDNYREVQRFEELGVIDWLMFSFFHKYCKVISFIILKLK